MKLQNNLVWLDLEMSGLDITKDVILEIATTVTTSNLEIVAQGPSLVIHQPDNILESMNDWCKKHHGASGLTQAVQQSTVSLEQAQEKTLAFIRLHCVEEKTLLCGNSIWQDKMFLEKYMPQLYKFFNYRIIDVSSIKEVVRRWYPNNPYAEFKKKDAHRAENDIKESIHELRHYRNHFFTPH